MALAIPMERPSNMACLYQITNLVNAKYYIGVHACGVLCSRETQCPYMGSGLGIKAAIKKYGQDNFKRDVLAEHDDVQFLYQLEAAVVNEAFVKRSNTYNRKVGGKGGPLGNQYGLGNKNNIGRVRPLSERQQISQSMMGKQNSLGTHNRLGHKASPETLQKMREHCGHSHSVETKQRISATMRQLHQQD
jgi:hypothetical protein